MHQTLIDTLPENLQIRFRAVIQVLPVYWEKKRFLHFTNHGVAHSERVFLQLVQLIQELPANQRLTTDELFIVSTATWLYETGMQSPYLQDVLNIEYKPGQNLSPTHLEEVRRSKHLLTEYLLRENVSSASRKPALPLSLSNPPDEYTQLIIEVCRWCSAEPLTDVLPEERPLHGDKVRLRLLIALLRLADQLYIDPVRVNLERLAYSQLPLKQLARWWVYQYTKVLPLQKGIIRFYYSLPPDQKLFLKQIRFLIESNFSYERNPTMRYLRDDYDLRLMPNIEPTFVIDKYSFFQPPMSHELLVYLESGKELELEMPVVLPTPTKVMLSFENVWTEFVVEKRHRFILDLSRAISILPEQIHILRMTPESAQIVLELPQDAASLLLSMHIANDPSLHKLHITKIELVPATKIVKVERLNKLKERNSSISPNLINRLRTVLLDCGPFATDHELMVIFVDERLSPWRGMLPQASNIIGRVESTIDFLHNRYNQSEENALVLLLRVLSERIDPSDACHKYLAELACEFEHEVKGLSGDSFES